MEVRKLTRFDQVPRSHGPRQRGSSVERGARALAAEWQIMRPLELPLSAEAMFVTPLVLEQSDQFTIRTLKEKLILHAPPPYDHACDLTYHH